VRAAVVVAIAIAAVACGDNFQGNVTIRATDELQPVLTEYARVTPYRIPVVGLDGPKDPGAGFTITVALDASLPAQAYQLHQVDDTEIAVAAPDALGAQYGTTAALEALGFRFRHPFDPVIPKHPAMGVVDEDLHKPAIRVRGIHLHTLHPIEGYFAFWEPGPQSTGDAHRIIDWVIKNRGNFLQWAALDDILDPDRYQAWKSFTRELIDYAHLRGIRVGLNMQLFGASNLQLAFDLVDEEDMPIGPQIAERLPLLTTDLPFDVYDLSFGEFFNADPQTFVDSVNEVYNQLRVLAPQAEMHAIIHVGSNQRVSFMGEDLDYYFLVKFADPSIIPDVHSVMFYDLFEPTGGAYQHADFSEHRQFLLDRMCTGQPAAYYPETAYWVAFDDSVPQFLPLYVHNRWLDLQMLDAQPGCGSLDNHLLFSTGWEWGYWLHDVTALRASYELPSSSTELIADELDRDHPGVAEVLGQLIETQRTHLMLGELVPYIAGRDTAIDAGRQLGIVSQPDRITFDDLVAGAEDPIVFSVGVLQPLAAYANELDAVKSELDKLDLPDDRWTRELADGIAIDRVRARFVLETYTATLSQLAGDHAAATDHLARARSLLSDGQAIVARRHRDLHDVFGGRLLGETANRTFYQFGYLFMADTLCYWNRELVQVGDIVDSVSAPTPSCLF